MNMLCQQIEWYKDIEVRYHFQNLSTVSLIATVMN